MKKYIIKNYLSIFESFFLGIIAFFVNIFVANQYGPEDYGKIIFVINLIFSFLIISSLSSAKIAIKYSEIIGEKNTISSIFYINLFFSSLGFLFISFLGYFFFQDLFIMIFILSFYLFLNTIKVSRNLFLKKEKGNKISTFFLISISIGLILRYYFASVNIQKEFFILSYLIEAIIWNIFLIKELKKEKIIPFIKINKNYIKIIFKQSFFNALSVFINKLNNISLSFLITSLLGFSVFSFYILASRTISLIFEIIIQLNTIIFSFKKTNTFKINILFSIIIFIPFYLLSEPILSLLLSNEYSKTIYFAKNLSFLFLIFPFHENIKDKYLNNEKMNLFFILKTLSIIITIPLSYFLILIYKENGILFSIYFFELISLLFIYFKQRKIIIGM